jgi:hypothetical protein
MAPEMGKTHSNAQCPMPNAPVGVAISAKQELAKIEGGVYYKFTNLAPLPAVAAFTGSQVLPTVFCRGF